MPSSGERQALTEHYFTSFPGSAHKTRSFPLEYQGEQFLFETDAGVFSGDALDEGTRLLLDAVIPTLSGRVLDLGCGWGPAGIIAGRLRPECHITMTDINDRACALADENKKRNRVQAGVAQGDGLSAVQGDFDWILLNPPIRAGKQVVYSLFIQAGNRLSAGGTLAVVIRKQQGAASQNLFGKACFLLCPWPSRKKGYHVFFLQGGEKVTYDSAFFDKGINRSGTNSVKWGARDVMQEGIIPLRVADMDFAAAEPIRQALIKRAEHASYGYTYAGPEK